MSNKNPLKDPRTNWKYLLIIVVLAAIVGGGILASQYWGMTKQLLTFLTPFDFSLSLEPNSSTVTPAGSVTTKIIVTLISGSPWKVSFSVSDLPPGVKTSFSQSSCRPSCSSIMTLYAGSTTPPGIHSITIIGKHGKLIRTATFTLAVIVTPTLSVSLLVNPSSGPAPLNNVDLTATVSGTATGPINYTFYCNRSDSGTNITPDYNHKIDGITTNPYTAIDVCNFAAPGAYTAKVIVERGTLAAESKATITVTAPIVTYTLTISKSGTGSGTVISSPSGINCGPICSASFNSGTVVILTASPGSNSIFASWSGDCSGMDNCTLTMNSNKAVTATFFDIGYIIVVPANEQVAESFDFESGSGPTPAGWTTGAWHPLEAEFTWESALGHTGSRSIGITLNTANDARWIHTVNLEPRNAYKLEGYIKGDNIINQDGGTVGAHLNVDAWERTDDIKGTFDWTKASLIFPVPYSGTTEIKCRLGFFWNTVTGKAWCDDLVLISNPLTKYEGAHIYLMLEPGDLTVISEDNMKQWVTNLDKVYNSYSELVGAQPFDGQKNGVLSVTKYPGGWAVAGNPIKWHQIYVKDELSSVNDSGNWSFGIMHEIGHSFDWVAWNWDAEFFANFKMYYAIENLNGKVKQGIYYVGSELKNYYQTDSSQSYDKTLKLGIYKGDGLTYKFISIRDQIGWEPFRQTFRYFVNMPSDQIPTTGLGKFNLFLDKLTDFSGVNVRDMFPAIEMDAIIAHLSG